MSKKEKIQQIKDAFKPKKGLIRIFMEGESEPRFTIETDGSTYDYTVPALAPHWLPNMIEMAKLHADSEAWQRALEKVRASLRIK